MGGLLRAEEDIAELPVGSASSFEGKPAPPPPSNVPGRRIGSSTLFTGDGGIGG